MFLSNISTVFADPVSDALLDGAADKAKEVIARAEAAGDAIAKAFGEQALAAIEALRVAAHDTTMEISQQVEERQKQLVNDLQSTLDQLMAGEAVAMDDLTRLTADIGGQIKNLPFTNQAAELMMYQPRVVVADGPATIALKAIGPKLGDTNATLSFNGRQIPVNFSTDKELFAQIDREILPFSEFDPVYATFKLSFDRSNKIWWQPWTWFVSDVVSRDLTLMLMPKRMASFEIATTVNQVGSESKDYVTTIGAGGKDRAIFYPVGIPQLDAEGGWQIDTDKLLSQGLPFANVGGDKGDCVGMVKDQLTRQQLVFHLQFGHRTTN